MLKYSEDAKLFMEFLGITEVEFESWYLNFQWGIGTAYVFNYLKAKKENKLNFDTNFNKELIKCLVLSSQAKIILKYIKDFNEIEFKKYYANSFIIPREAITDYIINKKNKSNILLLKKR